MNMHKIMHILYQCGYWHVHGPLGCDAPEKIIHMGKLFSLVYSWYSCHGTSLGMYVDSTKMNYSILVRL